MVSSSAVWDGGNNLAGFGPITDDPRGNANRLQYDPDTDDVVIYAGGYWLKNQPPILVDGKKFPDVYADGLGYWQSTRSSITPPENEGPYAVLADPDFYINYVNQKDFSNWNFEVLDTRARLTPWQTRIAQAKYKPGEVPALPWDILKRFRSTPEYEFDVFYIVSPPMLANAILETGENGAYFMYKFLLFGQYDSHKFKNKNGLALLSLEDASQLFREFKQLFNNITLNGAGTQKELGAYRESLFMRFPHISISSAFRQNGRVRYSDRYVSPGIFVFDFTTNATAIVRDYFEVTRNEYITAVGAIRDFMLRIATHFPQGEIVTQKFYQYCENINQELINELSGALKARQNKKKGPKKSDDPSIRNDPFWLDFYLQQEAEEENKKDLPFVAKLRTAQVTRFPADLPKKQVTRAEPRRG